MSVLCNCGHVSVATDYCDRCGALLASDDDPSGDPGIGSSGAVTAPRRTEIILDYPLDAPAELCPSCASPRVDGDRFCEIDGYDFESGVPAQFALGWQAVVAPDRSYYDRVAPDDVSFPTDATSRIVALGDDALIGRRSDSRGVVPEIDLSLPPEDPAVSRRHARIVRFGDTYTLIDDGSANGTSLNDATDLIPPGTPVPLVDGDRIHVGAWTTITIRRVAPA